MANINSLTTNNDFTICRLCATPLSPDKGVELFTEGSQRWDEVVRALFGYMGREYVFDVDLPNWVCLVCQVDAESAKKFVEKIVKAQKQLEALFDLRTVQRQAALKQQKEQLLQEHLFHCEEMPENDFQAAVPPAAAHPGAFNEEELVEPQGDGYAVYEITSLPALIATPAVAPNPVQPPEGTPKRVRRTPSRNTNNEASLLKNKRPPKTKPQPKVDSAQTKAGLPEVVLLQNRPKTKKTYIRSRYVCSICSRRFLGERSLLEHTKCHKDCRLQCKSCLDIFQNCKNCLQHRGESGHAGITILEMADENEVPREETTANGAPLAPVVPVSNGESGERVGFVCYQCRKTYTSPYAVRRHYRQVHLKSKMLTCPYCPKLYKNHNNLKYYLATHKDTRPFVCECGKEFNTKHNLQRNKRTSVPPSPPVATW